MNIAWKTGVNSQAIVLTGSPGFAGWRGGAGVWVGAGVPDAPGAPDDAGTAQPTTTRTTRTRSPTWAMRAHGNWRTAAGRASGLANGVIAAPAPRMAAGDAAHPHPAALDEPVLLDGLLRVARAGGLVATTRRHPREDDPVQPDHPDADLLQTVPPSTPPFARVRCNAPTSESWSASTIAGRAM